MYIMLLLSVDVHDVTIDKDVHHVPIVTRCTSCNYGLYMYIM